MHCVAIDDEPMALAIIEEYCSRHAGIQLRTFTDPCQGLQHINETLPDLLFLDIEMGTTNGVELARALPEGVKVIFTTAYAQFAIDGFEVNAVDFLHKPFSFTRFERALAKAERAISREEQSAEEEITLKIEYQSVRIALAKISHIESMDNYIKVHIDNSRTQLSQMSLKSIEDMLPAERFLRVHKSFIVARNWVSSYTRSTIKLRSGEQIPIGRTYQGVFRQWIEGVRS